jgi:hypothetical protein
MAAGLQVDVHQMYLQAMPSISFRYTEALAADWVHAISDPPCVFGHGVGVWQHDIGRREANQQQDTVSSWWVWGQACHLNPRASLAMLSTHEQAEPQQALLSSVIFVANAERDLATYISPHTPAIPKATYPARSGHNNRFLLMLILSQVGNQA